MTHEPHRNEFNKDILKIDPAAETNLIVAKLRKSVLDEFRRSGCVVGVSGGVDSSVVLALCLLAFDASRVKALMLPERESESDSEKFAKLLTDRRGVHAEIEEITEALDGFGCYDRRDQAIQRVFPDYDSSKGYKSKIVLPQNLLEKDILNIFYLTIITPDGEEKTKRLRPADFSQIIAASNFKQRSRMAMLYYHAELRNYAVIGTANKNEHDQGFFVKYGDSGVDIQPIAHLNKTQVYQLAQYLEIPEEIQNRTPTTDTYSAPCTQQEFFFRMQFETMDLLRYAQENKIPVPEIANVMGLEETQILRIFQEFTRRTRATQYLRAAPVFIGE